MSISKYPSKLSLPQEYPGADSVLDYLLIKFPHISAQVWQRRMAEGKVHWHDGSPITQETPYRPQQRVYYYREVEDEIVLPFEEEVLFQDDELLVAYKPHFMGVTPGGGCINECLQNRLRDKTGLDDLQAIHRLDRATAGLVLFSTNRVSRPLYHHRFNHHQADKTYQAIAKIKTENNLVGQQWEVRNRIVRSEPRFLMKIGEGEPNSHSQIRCLQQSSDRALFECKPITGRTHQLRLHMMSLGWPILHDRDYPTLQPKSADNYSQPLQLLAKELRFIDPLTLRPRVFGCPIELHLNS